MYERAMTSWSLIMTRENLGGNDSPENSRFTRGNEDGAGLTEKDLRNSSNSGIKAPRET
jgi:hypothetical protein